MSESNSFLTAPWRRPSSELRRRIRWILCSDRKRSPWGMFPYRTIRLLHPRETKYSHLFQLMIEAWILTCRLLREKVQGLILRIKRGVRVMINHRNVRHSPRLWEDEVMFQLLGCGGSLTPTSILLSMWGTFPGTKEEEKRGHQRSVLETNSIRRDSGYTPLSLTTHLIKGWLEALPNGMTIYGIRNQRIRY